MDYQSKQDFEKLRRQCCESNTLFVDDYFPPVSKSVMKNPNMQIEWLRPTDLIKQPKLPKFIDDETARFDCQQGRLGDCWVIAAVATLCLHRPLLEKVVPVEQSFGKDYCGIFHFRIWRYGHWVNVVVDDLLPTFKGKLLFMHSSSGSEFWSSLLEKAYAKLEGSYEALVGGSMMDALEDFTSGVTESIQFRDTESGQSWRADQVFQVLQKAFKRISLVGCYLLPPGHDEDLQAGIKDLHLRNGLVVGQVYSITGISKFVHQRTKQEIKLVRVRNPYGDKVEWNGPWSDHSVEWNDVSEDRRRKFLRIDDDGEFWMTIDDLTENFSAMELCNLPPDTLNDEKKSWCLASMNGSWRKNISAGGRRKYAHYAMNPQYDLRLLEPDEEDDNLCSVVIALMQKHRRMRQYQDGISYLAIGFHLYRIDDKAILPLDDTFFVDHNPDAKCAAYMEARENTKRFLLPPGRYVMVPSTYEEGKEGDFLLRVFSERRCETGDFSLVQDDGNIQEKQCTPANIQDFTRPQEYDAWLAYFNKNCGEDMAMDLHELQRAVNGAMKSRGMTLQFSKEFCVQMIAMVDFDFSGKVEFEEFMVLWTQIKQWMNIFKRADFDGSGRIDSREALHALRTLSVPINQYLNNLLFSRYGDTDGTIGFENFIIAGLKLSSLMHRFKSRSINGKMELDMGDWLLLGMYT